jgi:hypothetical protein
MIRYSVRELVLVGRADTLDSARPDLVFVHANDFGYFASTATAL